MIMQRAQKEVEQAEQDAIKSAEYNLEQARTKATTRRAFSCQPCASPLAHRLCNEVMGYFPHPQPFMEYI